MYNANDLKDYKKKVEHYLNSHKDELAIYKLRNNKKITKQDVETLEDILFNQLGNEADYEKEFGKTPVTQLVRKLVGDRKSTRLNSSHVSISYAVFCLKKKKNIL